MSEKNDAYTVLIADDDENLIQGICRRIRKEGFNIIIAFDGYQAVSLAREHRPDVMVLDVKMPAGDGFSVQERVNDLPELQGTPVIYITGERSEETFEKASQSGAYSMLYKPFETQALVKSIRQAIAGAKA